MKILKILIVSMVLLGCCNADTNDLKIIQQILTKEYNVGNEGFVVFCQTTAVHSVWGNHPNLTKILKTSVKRAFKNLESYDTDSLVEGLIEKNNQSIRLTIQSSSINGYVIDLDGKFEGYFKEFQSKGWQYFHEKNPDANGLGHISRPFYDREQNIIMVYIDMGAGPRAGAGYLLVYKYNDDRKIEIVKRIQLWIA